MAQSNALVELDVPFPSDEELKEQPTDTQPEDETLSPKQATEPSEAISKPDQAAIQAAREREKRERTERLRLEQELQQRDERLAELELQGLSETDRYRREAEIEKQKRLDLEQKLQVEEVKKEYSRFLEEKEAEHPSFVAYLKKQAAKSFYPVQGKDATEFEQNFEEAAVDFEDSRPEPAKKPTAVNPAYEAPSEVDLENEDSLKNLSVAELRKMLPKAQQRY